MASPSKYKNTIVSPTRRENRELATNKQKELAARLLNRQPRPIQNEVTSVPLVAEVPQVPQEVIRECFGNAQVPVYREDDAVQSIPSPGLAKLVDLYLDAANNKSRHIALVWPATPKALVTVHVLATLERWASGDKRGVRGLAFPVKTNAFHPLNHLHLDRNALLEHAQKLIEQQGKENKFLRRKFHEKDSFLFSMASLKPEVGETFNPTMSELIPHFFVGEKVKNWESCSDHLLEHIGAKLVRRTHKKALRSNCEVLGSPKTAPDALFAMDTRMPKADRKAALIALKKLGAPEVVLVNATRPVRLESRGWVKLIAKIRDEIDEVFSSDRPGFVFVVDDPQAAFQLRQEIVGPEVKSRADDRKSSRDYWITGICSATKADGLLASGVTAVEMPVPREFDIEVMDADASGVINRLYRMVGRLPGGRESAEPVIQAANYVARLAALPCGVNTLTEWLGDISVSEHARRVYSWATYHAALSEFERSEHAGSERKAIQECLTAATKLYENYQTATPLALRLADLIERSVRCRRHRTIVVFTSAVYRRLAERFLSTHAYSDGAKFEDFADRVSFVISSQLEEVLANLNGAQLVLVGLDEEGLRLAMTDNRVPKHTAVLLTQRAGQYLRTILAPLNEKFQDFKVLKPRMESFLRQLASLPEGQAVLSDDYVLPTFRTELTTETVGSNGSEDPDACRILLEGGGALFRKSTHKVFVYDPASGEATDRGFRSCEVKTLQAGDKLFVMSDDLRELMESVLKEAGVPIEHDKSFEGALRDYHNSIANALNNEFEGKTISDQVRKLRAQILKQYPHLATDFPEEQSVRYWIDLGTSVNTPFDQLKPQAPRKEAHFNAFAMALGLSGLQAAFYWQRVIMPIRNARRQDGRYVSDAYSYMLLQPESAMLNSKISRPTLRLLFQRARENLLVVENVILPMENNKDA
jgi:hypothetical protein